MFWTRCHIIGSYNLLLHICCMCCKPWYFSHCVQTWLCNVQTFCLQDPSLSGHAAHSLSFGTNPVSEVFESDVPSRSVRWKQPFPYIRAYMHTLDQRMATLYINVCALGPPAGTTRNFSTLVSMLSQTTRRGENQASGCQRFEKNVVFATAKLLIHSTK